MSTTTELQPSCHCHCHPHPGASVNSPPTRSTHNDDTHSTPAVHSGRLVYAKPQDLPSFPSVGLPQSGSAAGTAATLGWQSKTSPEIWKPDSSATASTAALLAQNHKMAAAWTPSPSSQGAQAALLAHKNARSTDSWRPAVTDDSHSAATQAFKAGQASKAEQETVPRFDNRDRAATLNRQRSLIAAKSAMKVRPRANTAPSTRDVYSDEAHATSNALRAATAAHGSKRPVGYAKGGAVPYTTMDRQMFTSHPPVKPEVDEQNREAQLHASAVAMARTLFTQQQKVIDAAKKAHADGARNHRRTRSTRSLSDDDEVPPMQFNTLQDAAYKLAQARLAKLHEDNLKNRDYQDYYGQSRPRRKFTIMGKLQRKRSSSEGDIVADKKRSQQIRNQMSIFSTKLSEVDEKKRRQDRDAVLAAAQRNVQAKLRGMDEKIAAETGMVPPSSLTAWEVKAQAAAQTRSDDRMSKHGKVDLGAGKFMDQSEIDAIAAQRVQPTIDEINEKAEKEHARQAKLREEAEAQKEAAQKEKAREREVAEIAKKLREQDKQETKERKADEKKEAKAKKEEEKAARAEQKRLAKSEKHRSAPIALPLHRSSQEEHQDELHGKQPAVEPVSNERITLNDIGQPVKIPAPTAPVVPAEAANSPKIDIPKKEQPGTADESSPTEKVSPTGKVKTWFKSRFSRGSKSDDDKPKDTSKRGFIGGHALTGIDSHNVSTASVDNRSSSVRAVAMAGKPGTDQSEPSAAQDGNSDNVSALSSTSDEEYFTDTRVGAPTELSPPHPLQDPAVKKSHSPVRDSRFHEII